jgi:hypothetical protein
LAFRKYEKKKVLTIFGLVMGFGLNQREDRITHWPFLFFLNRELGRNKY